MKKHIKGMFITMGAYVSANVGAAFASGNELLQFFGSWGGTDTVISVVAGFITTVIYTACLYYIGQGEKFETSVDAYAFFGGKILGRFFQIFSAILSAATVMLLFSGAGSLFWQEFGVPVWVGAVLLGVVSVAIVIGGLSRVQNVLGYAGIIILIYILIFGVITLFNPESSMSQVAGVTEMVDEGIIWQANLFTLFPFSLFPKLAELNSPVLDGVLYGTLCIVPGFLFYLSLGERSKKAGEAVGSAVLSTAAYFVCIALVLVLVMMNFDAVLNPETGEMYPFPAVAVIRSFWPSGSWTYVVILFVAIFTTYTAILWSLNRVIFEKNENSKKSHVFVVALTIFGICFGSVLPFSEFVNILQPVSGVVGLLMMATIVVKTLQICRKKDKALPNC